jgi:hypothetical protein
VAGDETTALKVMTTATTSRMTRRAMRRLILPPTMAATSRFLIAGIAARDARLRDVWLGEHAADSTINRPALTAHAADSKGRRRAPARAPC